MQLIVNTFLKYKNHFASFKNWPLSYFEWLLIIVIDNTVYTKCSMISSKGCSIKINEIMENSFK